MNVYVAGKINKNDWRIDLPLKGDSPYSSPVEHNGDFKGTFPMSSFDHPAVTGHFYTGPYFIACDHGCYHRPNDHGVGATSGGENTGVDASREQAAKMCRDAISRSDVVFCWIDDASIYGSLFELGYAKALGKKIWIAGPSNIDDLWFAIGHADHVVWGVTDPVASLIDLLYTMQPA